jgi:hypothetical protein
MFVAQPTSGHAPPNLWIRIGAFNLAMAVTAGALAGIGLRSLLLAWIDRASGTKPTTLRVSKGIIFLALGWYYLAVAWPMLIWDHPARIVFMLTALAPPLVAAFRYSKGGLRGAPKLARQIVTWCLTFVFFVATALTLLRAGFITLKADRVPMLLEVTGEIRTSSELIGQGESQEILYQAARHVILLLPDGTPAADVWIPGDRVAFQGQAVIFSHALNAMGFPNLYRLERVTSERRIEIPVGSRRHLAALPPVGPLRVHSWWAPIQEAMLRFWPRADKDGSPFWGVRIFENQSPFYPLVNPDGTPLKKDFLLDLTLDGIPTSRFTSPLEKR